MMPPNAFLIVSYGMGLDSTSMLVEMKNRGIVPDLILFSDTGAEKPETYAYLELMNAWLRSVGFPTITVVKYQPVRAPYSTLEGKCLANETLPSLAFGQHSCALVFKRDVMIKFLKRHAPTLAAIEQGRPIVKAIGYDDSKADRRRSKKSARTVEIMEERIAARRADGKAPLSDQWEAANCELVYPLQDWGLERSALAKIIRDEGLQVPVKSACFFCPASKPEEVVELKRDHPELFERAVAIERGARDGRHGLSEKAGLGMGGWAWEWLQDVTDPALAAATIRSHGVKIKDGARP